MSVQIYLDYNATTPVDPRVLEAMLPFFTRSFGNAASATHSFGREAADAVEKARQQVADLISCTAGDLVFTSGATESINLALKGAFETYAAKGNHIVTVKTEHKAVLDVCKRLEQKGASIAYLGVDAEGLIDLNELQNAITEKTILVAVMLANNETGVIQPAEKIAEIVHARKSIFFCDATQAVGKLNVDVSEMGIDLLCLSAHKFYGPKGCGALYIRRKDPRVALTPQMDGGEHERGLRSGTLNVPGIVGLGKACAIAREDMWNDNTKISALRAKLEHQLLDFPGLRINGSTRNRLYNTSNICFKGKKTADLLVQLKPVALAFGSACTSANPEPSHVLKAMGMSDEDVYSSVRFSLGKYTSEEEIIETIKCIKENVYGK
jgi:cysteine desulfurase